MTRGAIGALAAASVVSIALVAPSAIRSSRTAPWSGRVTVNPAVAMDASPPLGSIGNLSAAPKPNVRPAGLPGHTGPGPHPPEPVADLSDTAAAVVAGARSGSRTVEQRTQGSRPARPVLASFDGLGAGFAGPQGEGRRLGNPSDNSLAVGRDHIVQIVNGGMAVFTKKGRLFDTTGRVLYGPMRTNAVFAGFGGACDVRNSGDAVVRYDQLADRWLYVLPVFQRDSVVAPIELTRVSRPGQAGQPGTPGPRDLIRSPAPPPPPPIVPGQQPGSGRGRGGAGGGRGGPPPSQNPYSMCYAVSTGPDPLGPYFRYQFLRPLFPDYPRPAVWPDGYYVPSSTSDNFIQKHACVADRNRMLQGQPATEQCLVIDGVNFLNNADIDGQGLPPAGAPNIMMAAGGSQLHQQFDDDGIYAWEFHVDWSDPGRTGLRGPLKIAVAPYHYLCNGQLTSCVPQPDSGRRLDAQGDKLMQRLVYRNVDGHESIVAVHSVNTSWGGGGVRWYEFRLDSRREPFLYQQGTYAPDSLFRWMGSAAIDRKGDIGVGFSFGGGGNFPGQRFAARTAGDPPGQLTFRESVLAAGAAAQRTQNRWEDYTTTAIDPSDDCTFWYVGDYLKAGSTSYSTRIGSFRVPGCREGTVAGSAFYDTNHDGVRDGAEPGLPGWRIEYGGARTGRLDTDAGGAFTVTLPADPAYGNTSYTFATTPRLHAGWTATAPGTADVPGLTRTPSGYDVQLGDHDYVTGVAFGAVCTVPARGAHDAAFWLSRAGAAMMAHLDSNWTRLFDSILVLDARGGRIRLPRGPAGFDTLRAWLPAALNGSEAQRRSAVFAVAGLNIVSGALDGSATIADPVRRDWPELRALLGRGSVALGASEPSANDYATLVDRLNSNSVDITPRNPASCRR